MVALGVVCRCLNGYVGGIGITKMKGWSFHSAWCQMEDLFVWLDVNFGRNSAFTFRFFSEKLQKTGSSCPKSPFSTKKRLFKITGVEVW